eukprot:COSAG02_NODE_1385_length_12954_cov_3.484250_2_plen_115_part_00
MYRNYRQMSAEDERKRKDEKFIQEANDSGAMDNPSYPLVSRDRDEFAHATCTITLCTDTGIDTSGNKRHIQWRRESVFGIARCCVRIVGHCHVVRRTERDRPARIIYRKLNHSI